TPSLTLRQAGPILGDCQPLQGRGLSARGRTALRRLNRFLSETNRMRHLCCRDVLLLLVVLLAGCAAGGGRELRRTGLLIEPIDAREIGYVANWSQDLQIGGDDRLVFIEALGDLVVAVQHPSNI